MSGDGWWAMGGYGWYVGMSYAAALALMVAEPLLARRRHRRARAEAAALEPEGDD